MVGFEPVGNDSRTTSDDQFSVDKYVKLVAAIGGVVNVKRADVLALAVEESAGASCVGVDGSRLLLGAMRATLLPRSNEAVSDSFNTLFR
jgi:hypothetical protein